MKPDQQNRPVRVGLISLGCAKNLVDAEIMLGSLLREGVEITNDVAQADALIVNTCSFIDAAQKESVDTILESAAVRDAQNRGQALIVSGCLPQRFREELPKLLPEVDAFMGIDQVANVAEIVKQAVAHRSPRPTAKLSTPNSKAKVVRQIAAFQKTNGETSHDDAENIRGTAKFGRTKRVSSPALKTPVNQAPAFPLSPGERENRQPTPEQSVRFDSLDSLNARADAPTENSSTPLVNIDARPHYIPDFATPRFRLTPKHFAYVKIAEGCNHPCSFCIIPRMRGSHRSRKQSDLVQEARQLIAEGVKELNLISQDSTFYGLDLRPTRSGTIAPPERFTEATKNLPPNATTLCTLLRELNSFPGEFWIRLLYTHPAHWTDELIRTIAECPKVARYIDMPLQHIHHNMLERMRRETSQQYILNLIARIRAGIPGVVLRTTFIVGFPGETEDYFQTLLDFIRETKFERLGVFTYSREEGTRAGNMASQIQDRIKKQRRNLAMAAQQLVARQVSESFVGRTIKVLVEKEATAKELKNAQVSSWEHGLIRGRDQHQDRLRGRFFVARGEADAPDIDGRVYVRGDLPLGDFARAKIAGHTDYDLIADPA